MTAPQPVRAGYVDTRWGQVHYRTSGTTGPWVALFHESPLSSKAFQGVLPRLGVSCRAVAFDTPGYGESAPPPSNGFEIPAYAEVLGEAMAALGMTRPVLTGVHTGSSIAIEAARHAPGGAAGLVLSGVCLFSPEERRDRLANWMPAVPTDMDGTQFHWAVQRYRGIYGDDAPTWVLNRAVLDIVNVAERYDWAYRGGVPARPDPLTGLLRRAGSPAQRGTRLARRNGRAGHGNRAGRPTGRLPRACGPCPHAHARALRRRSRRLRSRLLPAVGPLVKATPSDGPHENWEAS